MATENLVLQRPHSIKLLIVDGEPAVRAEFTELCRGVTGLKVLGEAGSGRAAIDAAQALAPDVVLIEVALPDMSGFDVLRHVGGSAGRFGIMTSRQLDWAERAIAEGALDYLVKPVSADRFEHAIGRVRQRYVLEETAEAQILRLLGRRPKLLVGERQHRLYPLDIEKIDYIEADGNYVTIRAGDAEYVSRDSIKRLAAEARRVWVRAHRSLDLVEYSGGPLCRTLGSRHTCVHTVFRDVLAFKQNLPRHNFKHIAVAPLSSGS